MSWIDWTCKHYTIVCGILSAFPQLESGTVWPVQAQYCYTQRSDLPCWLYLNWYDAVNRSFCFLGKLPPSHALLSITLDQCSTCLVSFCTKNLSQLCWYAYWVLCYTELLQFRPMDKEYLPSAGSIREPEVNQPSKLSAEESKKVSTIICKIVSHKPLPSAVHSQFVSRAQDEMSWSKLHYMSYATATHCICQCFKRVLWLSLLPLLLPWQEIEKAREPSGGRQGTVPPSQEKEGYVADLDE